MNDSGQLVFMSRSGSCDLGFTVQSRAKTMEKLGIKLRN